MYDYTGLNEVTLKEATRILNSTEWGNVEKWNLFGQYSDFININLQQKHQ
jgi:hypothetical protein